MNAVQLDKEYPVTLKVSKNPPFIFRTDTNAISNKYHPTHLFRTIQNFYRKKNNLNNIPLVHINSIKKYSIEELERINLTLKVAPITFYTAYTNRLLNPSTTNIHNIEVHLSYKPKNPDDKSYMNYIAPSLHDERNSFIMNYELQLDPIDEHLWEIKDIISMKLLKRFDGVK